MGLGRQVILGLKLRDADLHLRAIGTVSVFTGKEILIRTQHRARGALGFYVAQDVSADLRIAICARRRSEWGRIYEKPLA